MKNFYKQKKSSIKLMKLLPIFVLVILLVLGFWFYKNRNNDKQTPTVTNPAGTEKIDLSPPTEAEKKAVDQHKDDLGSQISGSSDTSTNTQQKSVTPVITDASKSEVRAYVPGVIENSGTCTVTASQGSVSKTFSSTGVADATTTICTPITMSGLGSGSWQLVLTYSSTNASGQSQPKQIQ